MAGIQSCYRKLLVVGASRFVYRNGVLHQSFRGKHHFVLGLFTQQNKLFFSKSKLLLNSGGQPIYRFVSTNVTEISKNSEAPAPAKDLPPPAVNETVSVESPNTSVVIDEAILPPIPSVEVTAPPNLEFISSGLTEPSLRSLGLGSWYPSGMIQQFLEFLHINYDLPWWAAIAVVTVILRIATFPVTLSCKKSTINMMNHMPHITEFQKKISEAKRNGDYFSAATHAQEFRQYVIDKNINLFSFLKPLVFQTPFFISMFWALRGMAEAPVESFKTQGVFWFQDLTASDPYYILPLCVGASVYAIMLVGAEGFSLSSVNGLFPKLFLRGLPVVVCAISTQFSASILWYWTTSNIIVLIQTSLLKIPAVMKFLKIPKQIKHNMSTFQAEKKSFIQEFREGLDNAKWTKEIEEREQLNALTFERAGSSPIPRTFKHNPKLANTGKTVTNKL